MHTTLRTFERCAALTAVALAGAHPRRRLDAALYLAHVEGAAPLRRLAEAIGRPLSSVHRAVRRVEAMRDDPLLDRIFDDLAEAARVHVSDEEQCDSPLFQAAFLGELPETERLMGLALAALEAPGAFLMVAAGAERAGVFARTREAGRPVLLTSVRIASEMAARDWLRLVSRTRASARYLISDAGRAALARRRAEKAGPERETASGTPQIVPAESAAASPPAGRIESPLAWLARRKAPQGGPFLSSEEVEAGERLREAYERAQLGPRVTQDWRAFLAPGRGRGGAEPARGPAEARERVRAALEALGPGLADVALRTCCLQEGLETTERRMGWSARSGKIVLKIALQRLALHYGIGPDPGHVAMQQSQC